MTQAPPPTVFTTDDYVLPEWAALPKYNFFFQVIKDGIIVSNLPIKKKLFSLIGRLEDLCDLHIDNPTVSRKHAILQFQSSQPLPYLYDLGNTHGTSVNKQRLPPKVYKKLQLFSNIKFGVSSRYYILRCPQLQQRNILQEQQKEQQFLKTLTQQKKTLTKQQAKKRYLELLQNDPYFGGQLKSRKFQGQSKQPQNYVKNNNNKKDEGISWGIEDQNQVYAYTNDKQFPIEPDVIRRLPGLDQSMLQKITQYQTKFRLYDQIEGQLNQLANKQKRQYGLQQKLQSKKQRLQKKFVESLEALEKCQDWIKVHVFGDESQWNNNKKKEKQKQADTFSDDQFYDRTLEERREKKEGKKEQKGKGKNNNAKIHEQISGVEDLWKLKNTFIADLKNKKQLLLLTKNSTTSNQSNTIPAQEQADQFQLFMKQTNQNLQRQNQSIQKRQLQQIQLKLKSTKQLLGKFLTNKQIQKMQDQILNEEQYKNSLAYHEELQKKAKKEKQNEMMNLSSTLEKIERQQKKITISKNKTLLQKGKRLQMIKQRIKNQSQPTTNQQQDNVQYDQAQLDQNNPNSYKVRLHNNHAQQQLQDDPQQLFQLYKAQIQYQKRGGRDGNQQQYENYQQYERDMYYMKRNQPVSGIQTMENGRKIVHLNQQIEQNDREYDRGQNQQSQQQDDYNQVIDITKRFQ